MSDDANTDGKAEVKASLNNYRVSAQKARLVADQIRGKGVEEALNLLTLSPKRISGPIEKLIRSAVANAEQKNENQRAGIEIDNLVVSTIYVNEGPSMWRIDTTTLKAEPPSLLPGVTGVLSAVEHEGRVFIGTRSGEVQEIDLEVRGPVGQRALGGHPARLLAAGGTLFVGDTARRQLHRLPLDALFEGEVASRPLDFAPRDLAWLEGALWIASDVGLGRLDAEDELVYRRREPTWSAVPLPANQLGAPALALGGGVRVSTYIQAPGSEALTEVATVRGSGARRLLHFVARP